MRRLRPGGRTLRTQEAVFAAVRDILVEKEPAAVSMVEIAARAGVAATSLYRRWGDARTLLTEVAVEHIMRESPLPDTGSLRGDLAAWAKSVASGLASPEGSMFFRVYVGAAPRSPEEGSGRARAMSRRLEEIDGMLDRARRRGETAPRVIDVTDHLLAPLYMRALFGSPADERAAVGLVDFLLDAVAARRG